MQAVLDFEKVLQRFPLDKDEKAIAWKSCCAERITCNRLTYMYGLFLSAFDAKGSEPNALRERITLGLKQLKTLQLDSAMLLPLVWDAITKATKGTYSP